MIIPSRRIFNAKNPLPIGRGQNQTNHFFRVIKAPTSEPTKAIGANRTNSHSEHMINSAENTVSGWSPKFRPRYGLPHYIQLDYELLLRVLDFLLQAFFLFKQKENAEMREVYIL